MTEYEWKTNQSLHPLNDILVASLDDEGWVLNKVICCCLEKYICSLSYFVPDYIWQDRWAFRISSHLIQFFLKCQLLWHVQVQLPNNFYQFHQPCPKTLQKILQTKIIITVWLKKYQLKKKQTLFYPTCTYICTKWGPCRILGKCTPTHWPET